MADWYVSSAAYATYTAFQISHAYIIGDLVIPISPALKAKYVLRCTTAGTSAGSEPTWPTANNGTVTSGSAIFTNVTGQSTYFWTAAAGDLATINGGGGTIRFATGDRVFLSSDHSETQTSTTNYGSGTLGSSMGMVQFLSVSRAGSTPPVAADLLAGAVIASSTGGLNLLTTCKCYHYGITYTQSAESWYSFGSGKTHYFDTCQIKLTATGSSWSIITFSNPVAIIFDNTTVEFGNAGQCFSTGATMDITWINTPSAIAGATFPTSLVNPGATPLWMTARGVDLSAITGTLVTSGSAGGKYAFENCKIAPAVTRFTLTAGVAVLNDQVDLINCYDGTNTISERYMMAGVVTTEFTITLTGGATDDVGTYSHKMVSNANIDKFVQPLNGFWMDIQCAAFGVPKTASVEIISSTTLKDDEIALYLEYEGTAVSSVASFTDSFILTPLTTPANVATSSATWNSSPATPVKQVLSVTFTPQTAGRLRGQVRLGKSSTTVYYNPQMRIAL